MESSPTLTTTTPSSPTPSTTPHHTATTAVTITTTYHHLAPPGALKFPLLLLFFLLGVTSLSLETLFSDRQRYSSSTLTAVFKNKKRKEKSDFERRESGTRVREGVGRHQGWGRLEDWGGGGGAVFKVGMGAEGGWRVLQTKTASPRSCRASRGTWRLLKGRRGRHWRKTNT